MLDISHCVVFIAASLHVESIDSTQERERERERDALEMH